MKINDFVIGKENNGYIKANSTTMLKVITLFEETGAFTGTIVGTYSFATNSWKAKKNGETFYDLDIDKFVPATSTQINQVFPPKPTNAKVKEKIQLTKKYSVVFKEDGTIESNLNPENKMIPEISTERQRELSEICSECKNQTDFNFMAAIQKYSTINMWDKQETINCLQQFINFFKEFDFVPSLRFTNTFARILSSEGDKAAAEYIRNYFALCNHLHKMEIAEKIESAEFKTLVKKLQVYEPQSKINKIITVWYGAPGTGKTYKATHLTEGRCVVCNRDLQPNDLLEDFDFVDGKPVYKPSLLVYCAENGLPLTLDEANLCNNDVLGFLQGITDNKESFNYKDRVIHIKPGFKLYMTMNLVINGDTCGLTEALVDRAEEIQEFTLNGENLLSAIF